jgi:hypothetical protein
VAFLWYLQSLNLEISLLVLDETRRTNGQTKVEDLEIKTALRKFIAEAHITLGIFAADRDA